MAVQKATKSTKETIAQNVRVSNNIYRQIYYSTDEDETLKDTSTDEDETLKDTSPDAESPIRNGKIESPEKTVAPAVKVSKTNRPSVFLLVCEAIKEVGTEKKGASVHGIRKWILGNYTDIDSSRLKLPLKKALQKGIETGVLERPSSSAESIGATGWFKLGKKNTEVKEAKVTKKSKKPAEGKQLNDPDSSKPITKKNKKPSTNTKKTSKPKNIKSVSSDSEVIAQQNKNKSVSSDTEITLAQTKKKPVAKKTSKSDNEADQVETKPKRAPKKAVKPKRADAPVAKPGLSSKTNKVVKSKAAAQKLKNQNSD